MKKLLLSAILFNIVFFVKSQCSQSCDQRLTTGFSIQQFNSFAQSNNWQYFGSNNQTRVRVVYDANCTPSNTVNYIVNGCNNGLIGDNSVNFKSTITVEAEFRVGGIWKKRSTFKPDFRLQFSNMAMIYNTNFISSDPANNLSRIFGNCVTNLACINPTPNVPYYLTPNNLAQLPNGWFRPTTNSIIQGNNLNYEVLTLNPSGPINIICGDNWFTRLPRFIGTINCTAQIGGTWRNLGNIVLN